MAAGARSTCREIVPLLGTTNADGFSSTRIPIPPVPTLQGVSVYAQAVVQDALGPFLGFSATAGLQTMLGD